MWFGMLLVVAVVGLLWKWILGAAIFYGVRKVAMYLADEHYANAQAMAEVKAELVARADEQHRLVLAGDQRGIYGMYPPAV